MDINKLHSIQYSDVVKTNEMSIANIDIPINITNLNKIFVLENDNLKLTNINSNSGFNGMMCSNVTILTKKDSNLANLKIFPFKIQTIYSNEIEKILDNHLSKYNIQYEKYINHKSKKIIINIIFGTNEDVTKLHESLNTEPEHDFDFKPCKIHATGLRTNTSWNLILENLIPLLYENNIMSQNIIISNNYNIINNCKYNVGFRINLWNLVQNINKVEEFKNSLHLYDNLRKPHELTIKLPLDNQSDNILWRSNVETTYIIKYTGTISQSSPSEKISKKSFDMLIKAFKQLEKNIRI